MAYDPRAIANLILDIRDELGSGTTNLELQKILYFSHAKHLLKFREPLVGGVFEAWRNGPVNPAVYQAFKDFGSSPISKRARKRDYSTRTYKDFQVDFTPNVTLLVRDTVEKLFGMTAWELVDLSHAKNGPWHHVVTTARNSFVAGMRISDELTLERAIHLKREVGLASNTCSTNVLLEPFEKRPS